MNEVLVYGEWYWTCDKCGADCEEPFDERIWAENAARRHECEPKDEQQSDMARREAVAERPGCGALHDIEPCRREAADCDCCRAILQAK